MNTFKNPIEIAKLRHQALKAIRHYFDQQNFIEIDAPVMIPANAVEAFIDPVSLTINNPDGSQRKAYLATSPEIHMKRLLSAGAERIYSLGSVFRDREGSPKHLIEFTMLEWYRKETELDELEHDCEDLFRSLFSALRPFSTNALIDLGGSFDRISVAQAWAQYAQIDLEECLESIATGDERALTKCLSEKGEYIDRDADFDHAFSHVMLKYIEPAIGRKRPCVLFDWPAQTAALARLVPNNPLFAQRFEIYCGGIELANAFCELTDHIEQRSRFEEANHIRRSVDREELPMPEPFLRDLSLMPPASGIAVGVDRLIALMCGQLDIRNVRPLANC